VNFLPHRGEIAHLVTRRQAAFPLELWSKLLKRMSRSRPQNNIRLVSVADNHACDAREKEFERTLELLRECEIKYCGGGVSISAARAACSLEAPTRACGG